MKDSPLVSDSLPPSRYSLVKQLGGGAYCKIQCRCANGLAMEKCPVGGAAACKRCYPGFHLEGKRCVLNQCRCDSGIPKDGNNGYYSPRDWELRLLSCQTTFPRIVMHHFCSL